MSLGAYMATYVDLVSRKRGFCDLEVVEEEVVEVKTDKNVVISPAHRGGG